MCFIQEGGPFFKRHKYSESHDYFFLIFADKSNEAGRHNVWGESQLQSNLNLPDCSFYYNHWRTQDFFWRAGAKIVQRAPAVCGGAPAHKKSSGTLPHFVHWKGTLEITLPPFVHWKGTPECTSPCFVQWRDTVESALPHLVHWKCTLIITGALRMFDRQGRKLVVGGGAPVGTLQFTLPCFVHWRGTLEGPSSCFIHCRGILESSFVLLFFSNIRARGRAIHTQWLYCTIKYSVNIITLWQCEKCSQR